MSSSSCSHYHFTALQLPGSLFVMRWLGPCDNWASPWDYGTYEVGDQWSLRRACASAQSCQSLSCLHTWSMEVDEGSDKKKTSSFTGWLCMQVWIMSLRMTKSIIISWYGSIELRHFYIEATGFGLIFCFMALQHIFRSFRARSVTLTTLFLGKPPRQFTST